MSDAQAITTLRTWLLAAMKQFPSDPRTTRFGFIRNSNSILFLESHVTSVTDLIGDAETYSETRTVLFDSDISDEITPFPDPTWEGIDPALALLALDKLYSKRVLVHL